MNRVNYERLEGTDQSEVPETTPSDNKNEGNYDSSSYNMYDGPIRSTSRGNSSTSSSRTNSSFRSESLQSSNDGNEDGLRKKLPPVGILDVVGFQNSVM